MKDDRREQKTPKTQCPKCGEWIEDHDGFGVLYHKACGYCKRASSTGNDEGQLICDYCGKQTGSYIPRKKNTCYKCGKVLELPKAKTQFIGTRISILIDAPLPDADLDHIKMLFGKYYDDVKKSNGIDFCHECWIDSLMGKTGGSE